MATTVTETTEEKDQNAVVLSEKECNRKIANLNEKIREKQREAKERRKIPSNGYGSGHRDVCVNTLIRERDQLDRYRSLLRNGATAGIDNVFKIRRPNGQKEKVHVTYLMTEQPDDKTLTVLPSTPIGKALCEAKALGRDFAILKNGTEQRIEILSIE